jgi:hypothetical protein
MNECRVEITVFENSGGPLTKAHRAARRQDRQRQFSLPWRMVTRAVIKLAW